MPFISKTRLEDLRNSRDRNTQDRSDTRVDQMQATVRRYDEARKERDQRIKNLLKILGEERVALISVEDRRSVDPRNGYEIFYTGVDWDLVEELANRRVSDEAAAKLDEILEDLA